MSEKLNKTTEITCTEGLSSPLVYVAKIPAGESPGILSTDRQKEIDRASLMSVKQQKYWSWVLLERAVFDAVKMTAEEAGVRRGSHGGLTSDRLFLSISHTCSFVAVAVSEKAIGVDIEEFGTHNVDKLASRYFVGGEIPVWLRGCKTDPEEAFLRLWCAKEAAFKSLSESVFAPGKLDSTLYKTRCERIAIGATELILALASLECDEARIKVIELH